jgi:hypothetical protein
MLELNGLFYVHLALKYGLEKRHQSKLNWDEEDI